MPFYRSDATLSDLGREILAATRSQFPELGEEQWACTWVVYDPPVFVNTGGALSAEEFWQRSPRGFSHRGNVQIYPASVVKLFYLVAIAEWLDKGMVPPSAELDRAIRDMVVISSNDATSLVVDVLSGTTSGPELPPAPFATWQYQRNIVNRYFRSLGWEELAEINVNQKTWSEDYYGRERAFVGENKENRNRLSTDATARLLHGIVGGVAVSGARSQLMLELLSRSLDPGRYVYNDDGENQVTGFLGEGLPPSAQLWSKAGWTSQGRHDAVYVELEGRSPYLLVVFVDGKLPTQERSLLPFISRQFLAAMECI